MSTAPRLDLTDTVDTIDDELRDRLHLCVATLAGVCDGAHTLDGQGFNGVHAPFGHSLARVPSGAWSDQMVAQAWVMCSRYRRQLHQHGIDFDAIPRPPGTEAATPSKRTLKAVVPVDGGFDVLFPYDPPVKDELRRLCPSARWNPAEKAWFVPTADAALLPMFAGKHQFVVPPDAFADAVPAATGPPPTDRCIDYDAVNAVLTIRFPFDPTANRAVSTLPGSRFDNEHRRWTAPLHLAKRVEALAADLDLDVTPAARSAMAAASGKLVVSLSVVGDQIRVRFPYRYDIAGAIRRFGNGFRYLKGLDAWVGLAVHGPALLEVLDALDVELVGADGLRVAATEHAARVAASHALDADLPPIPGLEAELKPFQRAGVAYALASRRCFISDEVGLGKTVQAIAAIAAADAFPAVIFMPQTLRVNWLREIARFLPGKEVVMASGTKPPRSFGMLHPDIVLCHYEISRWWKNTLIALNPQAVVCDESHLLKTPTTYRTQAVAAVASAVPDDGIRLNLTATPVLNDRKEFAAQLDVLGRLAEFGGTAAIRRMTDINERLRGSGAFIRRVKADVLPDLPPVSHVPVFMDGDPDIMEEYRRAEEELLDYLAEKAAGMAAADGLDPLDAAMDARLRASSAEHLVRIGVLRRLAARAKLPAARQWVEEYLASDKRLLLFAHNIEVLDDVEEEFGCPVIKGGQSSGERMGIVDRFQAGKDKMVALGLTAGGVGLTMTAAEDVAFLQQGWTPAIHDQAIGRTYGRLNDPHGCTGFYMLCNNSIDVRIAQLIDDKRREVNEATDGQTVDDDNPTAAGSILGDLVVDLTHDALRR